MLIEMLDAVTWEARYRAWALGLTQAATMQNRTTWYDAAWKIYR